MRNPSLKQALAAALFTLAASSLPAVEITRGTMLANSCAGCHGTDGESPGAIPSIHGKSAKFITEALTGFRDGTRESTVMGRHAKGYSDEEIRLLADYFSTRK
jgi:sulfide dehydrogenase cytochrome subunit